MSTTVSPRVTVQLPLFNEPDVAERLHRVQRVARIDYPREDKLEIQVLDDSTDETRAIAAPRSSELVASGLDAVYIHRTDRTGYKAGALDNGLHVAKGELVASSTPTSSRSPIPPHGGAPLRRPKVGMVQARWGHLNRDYSILTRVQAPHARRPPPGREPRALRRGAASSTSRAPAASGAARPSTTRAAGSTTRSPRTSTSRTARSSRAGASSTARRGHARRAPRGDEAFKRSSSAGPRARCRPRASSGTLSVHQAR
jgi:hypothetical protein